MFLICTADERFWRIDGPVLVLGEWCKAFSRRQLWNGVPHEVVPYHWDDRQKLDRDYRYLDELYERFLRELGSGLNEICGVDHGLRYWRIVLGPWLSIFLTAIFDRHACLEAAARTGKASLTVVGRYGDLDWLAPDIDPFRHWVAKSDAYNQFLFDWLVRALGTIPFVEAHVRDAGGRHPWEEAITFAPARPPGGLRRLFLQLDRWAGRAARFVSPRLKSVVLVASSLHPRDQLWLELRLGQLPTWSLPPVETPPARFDFAWRARLEPLGTASRFEELAAGAVRAQLPAVYLENYAVMRERTLAAYPRRPKVIFTANAFEGNEAFKLWAAECVEQGTKLVGPQHGCHYGTARVLDVENHQVKVSDRFYSWGWTAAETPRVVPLAAAKFNRALRLVRARPDGSVLVATLVWPRYACRPYSVPIAASGTLAHLTEYYRFIDALPEPIRRALVVRVFPVDRGWDQVGRFREAYPDVNCYRGPRKFLDQLCDCRLLVCAATSTTQLEAFAANFPTVLIWNPALFELRAEAQPYFDALARAGILHTEPGLAARKVSEIFEDVLAWWNQASIQAVRQEFAHRFARTSPDWLGQFRRELRQMAGSSNLAESDTRRA